MQPLPIPPRLEARRLWLRALHFGDVHSLFAIFGDAEVMRYAGEDPFRELSTVIRMLVHMDEQRIEGRSMEWGIQVRSGQGLIGTCSLHGLDRSRGLADVGCMLARTAWGHGYMQEALDTLFDYARHGLGLTLLQADIDAPNHRSIRTFAALGFKQVDATLYQFRL